MSFQERGVTLAGLNSSICKEGKMDPLMLTSLESSHPSGAKVFLNHQGHFEWPVLFLYPEHGETDFISRFNEHAKWGTSLLLVSKNNHWVTTSYLAFIPFATFDANAPLSHWGQTAHSVINQTIACSFLCGHIAPEILSWSFLKCSTHCSKCF